MAKVIYYYNYEIIHKSLLTGYNIVKPTMVVKKKRHDFIMFII